MENKRRNETMNSIIRTISDINAAYGTAKNDDKGNRTENVYFREIGDVTYVYADEKCTKEVRNTYYELPEFYRGNPLSDAPCFDKVNRIELSFSNDSQHPRISLYVPLRELPVCRMWYRKEETTYTFKGISDDKIVMLANVLLGEPAAKTEDKIYYIENTIDEWHTDIQGYFHTLDDAKEALKDCADWCRPKGTGKIYSIKFGLDQNPKLEYENQ